MNLKICLVATSILFSLSQTVFAGNEVASQQYDICMDKSEGITSEMLDCTGKEINKQDMRLNKAYKEVMAALSPTRKKSLRDAQRLWVKYRNANCNFYDNPDAGTSAQLNSSGCFLTETENRAKEIEGIKKMEGILG